MTLPDLALECARSICKRTAASDAVAQHVAAEDDRLGLRRRLGVGGRTRRTDLLIAILDRAHHGLDVSPFGVLDGIDEPTAAMMMLFENWDKPERSWREIMGDMDKAMQ